MIYIQDIEGTSNITKNFIAIQIVAELDNFLGSMYFVGIRKFRGVEFELERQQPVDQQDDKLNDDTFQDYSKPIPDPKGSMNDDKEGGS